MHYKCKSKKADISNPVHVCSYQGSEILPCGTIRLAKLTLIGCDEWNEYVLLEAKHLRKSFPSPGGGA